jgi:hypothetical protein
MFNLSDYGITIATSIDVSIVKNNFARAHSVVSV